MKLIFDIGGTKTRLGLSPDGSTISTVVEMDTLPDPQKNLAAMSGEIKKMAGRDKISVGCGGVAGVLDANKSGLLKSPNLTGWENFPLKKNIEKITGVRVYLVNDAAMEGLGEATMGAGRRKQTVAYLSIGTGIGGVKIHDGKICPAAAGFEPGHQIIDWGGKAGYLEHFASGRAMEKIFNRKPEEIDEPEIWEKETRLLAIGIHNAIVFWSPEMVILGGGLMQKIDLEYLKNLIREELIIFPVLPEIVRSELGEKSGLYGALAYLKTVSDF